MFIFLKNSTSFIVITKKQKTSVSIMKLKFLTLCFFYKNMLYKKIGARFAKKVRTRLEHVQFQMINLKHTTTMRFSKFNNVIPYHRFSQALNYLQSFDKQILMRLLMNSSSHCLIFKCSPAEYLRNYILHLVCHRYL